MEAISQVALEPAFLPLFGEPLIPTATRAALGVLNVHKTDDERSIEFGLKDARIISKGSGLAVLVIDLGQGQQSINPSTDMSARHDITRASEFRRGDTAFLSTCEEEELPRDIRELGANLLTRVRQFANDELVEGQARKWVAKPNNFLAITIQNTKKRFVITVRTTKTVERLSSLVVRDDRPGYSRFWLDSIGQLGDAVEAIKASHDA